MPGAGANPDEVQAQLRAALSARDFTAALDLARRLCMLEPDALSWPDLVLKISVQLNAGTTESPILEKAAADLINHPKMNAVGAFNLALRFRGMGLFRAAILAYERSLDLNAQAPHDIWTNMGVIWADDIGARAKAEAAFKTAIGLRPDALPAYLNLGNIYEEHGEFNAAIELYRRARRNAPPAYEALARLGHCVPRETGRDVLSDMISAADASDTPADARKSLLFSVGAYLDAVGEYDAAFDAFRRANALSPLPTYDRAAETAKIEAIINAFPAAMFKQQAAIADKTAPQPIFICGMFRSGSTLAEQIISGHSDVTACGEIPYFETLARSPKLALTPAKPLPDAQRRAFHAEYRAKPVVRDVATPYFTDKRPDNILYLGLIKQLFPQAKILRTTRAVRDNALSVFFTQFGAGQAYARDLNDIAHYQGLQDRLSAHWQRCFGADFITLHYDDVIAEPEAQAQGVMGALGLTWEPGCLAFHKRKNRVKTASYKQVRQKLYQHASGRAHNYDFAFKGLIKP